MAALVRAKDWSQTPLGPREQWSISLRTAVGICLNSRFPMFLWWGSTLTNIYNDAYIPILGRRHPDALGKSAPVLWAEVWSVIGPQVEGVVLRNEASWEYRVPLTVERNGYPEEACFTWSHSAVPDDAGDFGGVLCVVTEETVALQAERARDRYASQLQLALDAAQMGWWQLDPATRIITYDQRFREVFDITGDALPVDGMLSRLHSDDRGDIAATIDSALNPINPRPYSAEYRVLRSDQSVRWVESRGVVTFEGEGDQRRAMNFVGTVADVTERRQAEAEVREAQQRYRTVFEASRDGNIIYTPDGTIVEANPAACEMYGYSSQEIAGIYAPDAIHPDALPVFREFLRVAGSGGVFRCETIDYRRDGTAFPIEATGTSFTHRGRQLLMAVVRDISDRRRAEEARRMVEHRFQRLVEHSPLSTQLFWPDGRTRQVNAAFTQLFGIKFEELSSYNILKDPQLVNAGMMPLFERAFAGEAVVINPIFYKPDRGQFIGQKRWVGAHLYPVKDDAGQVVEVVLIHFDVTDQKLAEEALRESEERLRLGLEAGNTGTWDWDIVNDAITWSDKVYTFHGLKHEEFTGKAEQFSKLIHPDDVDMVARAAQDAIANGNPYASEFRVVHPDGTVRWVSTHGNVYYDQEGRPLRMMGATTDVTDRKRGEQEREKLLASEQAARAEAERQSRMKDEFLATLSHELRTPLNAILGWAQILRLERSPGGIAEGVEVIIRNARVQVSLIEELLDISRIISGKVRMDVQRVPLAPVIEGAIDAVRPAAAAKDIRLHTVLDPLAGPVAADRNRLTQIVFNLVSNAIKYTPKGGRVQVLLERVNSHVEITVADNGEGIDPAFLPLVFDRFRQADGSTTRRHGGLGLGLSIVKHLTELHGGSVQARSAGPGLGATFIVSLPLMPIHAAPAARASVEPPRRHPTAFAEETPLTAVSLKLIGLKVLVVDDEPDARALVRRLLEDCEAMVATASTAVEAMEMVRKFKPDILVSDVGMPVDDGLSLIGRIRELNEAEGGQIPAIALTAYARSEDRTRALLAGFNMHISKPVEPAELIATVASLGGRTGKH